MRGIGTGRGCNRSSGREASDRYADRPSVQRSLTCRRCRERVAIEGGNIGKRLCLPCVDAVLRENTAKRRTRLCK